MLVEGEDAVEGQGVGNDVDLARGKLEPAGNAEKHASLSALESTSRMIWEKETANLAKQPARRELELDWPTWREAHTMAATQVVWEQAEEAGPAREQQR